MPTHEPYFPAYARLGEPEEDRRIQQEILFNEQLTRAMGWLFPPGCRLVNAKNVLEVGCGRGAWARAMATAYKPAQVIGIDVDRQAIASAVVLAYRSETKGAMFVHRPVRTLNDLTFPARSFDAIRVALPAEVWLDVEVAPLLDSLYALCRPGGVLLWSLGEPPAPSSPTFDRLVVLLHEGLLRLSRQEEQVLFVENIELHKPGELSLSAWMRRWLDVLGLEQIREHDCALWLAAGTPVHGLFCTSLQRGLARLAPWLKELEVVQEQDWQELCAALWNEVRHPTFTGLLTIRSVWGTRPRSLRVPARASKE